MIVFISIPIFLIQKMQPGEKFGIYNRKIYRKMEIMLSLR